MNEFPPFTDEELSGTDEGMWDPNYTIGVRKSIELRRGPVPRKMAMRLLATLDAARAEGERYRKALEDLSLAAARTVHTYAPDQPLSRPLMDGAHRDLGAQVCKAEAALKAPPDA